MLLSIQFPHADSRGFLNNETGRLLRPNWPSPEPDSEFVRSFGGIARRKRGGVKECGENDVCEASGALRFRRFPDNTYRCAFRRFFSDGYALGKLEVGIATRAKVNLGARKTQDALYTFLNCPVRIRQSSGKFVDCELWQAGKYLAELYTFCTTLRKCGIQSQDWWVQAGTPLLFLEINEGEVAEFPFKLKRKPVNIPQEYGIRLTHCFVGGGGRDIPMWILERKGPSIPNWIKAELPPGRPTGERKEWLKSYVRQDQMDEILWRREERFFKARALRLYLLRLHALHHCLRTILKNVTTGRIPVEQGSSGTLRLERYLDKAIKWLSKWESKSEALVDADVASLARESQDAMMPGQRDGLLNLFEREKVRFEVRRVVSSYVNNVYTNGGDFIMGDGAKKTGDEIHVGDISGQAVIGSNAHVHDVNFNQVWNQIGSGIDLSGLASDLTTLLPELRKRAAEPTHDKAVVAVGEAATAAREGDGPKTLRYLKQGGEWVFKVATDIGVRVAAEAMKHVLYPSPTP